MKTSAAVLLLAVATATPEIRYFQYQRAIPNSSGQSCLVVDAGIYAHAAPDLTDLRLYRDGVETPFAVRADAATASEEKPLTPLNLGSNGGQTVFDANLPEGHFSDLQLDVDGANFIATVTVTGSQTESGGAGTRVGSYTIFDLTGQKLGRSTVLHLPESDFRYLHFRISGRLTPKSIAGLSVAGLHSSPPRYLTVAESAQVVRKGRTSVLEFKVPAHVPVERIEFTVGNDPAQFSRGSSVQVTPIPSSAQSQSGQALPIYRAEGGILRIHSVQDGRRIDEERMTMDAPWFDASTATRWTVAIDNGDDAPLRLQTVRLKMRERSVCFEAAAQANYVLYYGDGALRTPSYDYARLFAAQANAKWITPGAEQVNAAYQPRPDERPFSERHPALLWVALIAVIGLLGVVAIRSPKAAAPQEKQ